MKIDNKIRLGIQIIILSLIFGFAETAYFGFNWLPSCHAEKVCDIISMSAWFIGCVVFLIGLDELFN